MMKSKFNDKNYKITMVSKIIFLKSNHCLIMEFIKATKDNRVTET